MKFSLISFACVIVISVVSVSVYVLNRDVEATALSTTRDEWRSKLINEIRLASKTSHAPIEVVSAPRPRGLKDQDRRITVPKPDYDLDADYEVIPPPIEMKKVRVTRSRTLDATEPILEPWLDSERGIDSLMRLASKSNRSWTYGWVQLAHPLKIVEISNALDDLGAEVLGSAGPLVRLRLPSSRELLEQIAAISWVSGIGAHPPEYKISDAFAAEINQASASEAVAVFITLMSGEDHDTWRQDLVNSGATIGYYDPAIRVFEAVVSFRQIPDLLAEDFVLSIEPIGIATTSHESAVPAMGVDALRKVGNLAGTYTGMVGSSVPIGVLDTGLNTNHVDISSKRLSICGANFVSGEEYDLWVDTSGHGTHVTGTIAGNGFHQPAYAGMAPGVQHIRIAKVLALGGFGDFADIHRGMDFLSNAVACPEAGWTGDAIKPLIVNISFSSRSLRWEGRSTAPRKLDSIVWTNRQLYVVSNANSSFNGFSNYASAKNSLAVGATHDSGDLAEFSSIGPTRDGRLIPQIVGTGVDITSALGNRNRDEYHTISGTSFSTPSVAGVAALLMDAVPEHKEQPALVRARLLASAVKPAAWFESKESFPRNNSSGPGEVQNLFGLGKVSARTSVLNRDTNVGWVSGSAVAEMSNDAYAFVDIEVPENASRVDIVLAWDEPPTDTISRAVLNDLNLWVDVNADCDREECGEYVSESTIDNLEWVIISNPEPGSYRVKVTPKAVYTQPPRAAVAWTIIRGDAVPQLAIETKQQFFKNSGDAEHEIDLWLTSSSYVAAGTRLHIDCRTYEDGSCGDFHSKNHQLFEPWEHESYIDREDDIAVETSRARYISVGEIVEGERQRVSLTLKIEKSDEPAQMYFTATAWNGNAGQASVVFEPEESEGEPGRESVTPENDDFHNAILLTGQDGVLSIDTLLASSEDGEPVIRSTAERPAASIWYSWVAEDTGIAGFSVNPTNNWPDRYLRAHEPEVDVFEGDHISSLQLIASSTWSAQFFAEQDKTYHVRISHSRSSLPLMLQWFTGPRPKNDDFSQAIVIEGETRTLSGTNLGATIEPGEQFGELASSAWWRWTAPRDGIWEVRVEDAVNLVVLAFTGNQVDDLRLVSSFPSFGLGDSTIFPVREGEEYFIMLASADAYQGGSKFEALTLSESKSSLYEGDSFRDPISVVADEGERKVFLRNDLTVDPGEPKETGVRTSWLKWTPKTSGNYTWDWDRNRMRVAVFIEDSMNNLQLVTHGGGTAHEGELTFSAEESNEYWISFGLVTRDAGAYRENHFSSTVRWGHSPLNDVVGDAEEILDATGNTTGTTAFATTETDGHVRLGHNSVWYTMTPGESAWYKIWVDDPDAPLIVSVFRRESETGATSLITHSRSQRIQGEGTEVTLQLESGNEYLIRIGSKGANQSIQFTLNWDQTLTPQWLRYVGRFADGWRDTAGRIVSLGNPRDLEFNTSGTRLFASTNKGLTVFNRDVTSGFLELESIHSEILVDWGVYLKWDPHRERLYIRDRCDWWVYSPTANPKIKQLEDTDACYGGAFYGAKPLSLGKDGNFLYQSSYGFTNLFRFTKSGALEYVGDSFEIQDRANHVVHPFSDGSHWFIRQHGLLSIYARKNGTGYFERVTDSISMFDFGFVKSPEDQIVFAYDRHGNSSKDVGVYETANDLTLVEEKARTTLSDLQLNFCYKAAARSGSYTIDVLCVNGAFVAEYLPESSEVVLRDYLINEGSRSWHKQQRDRFGNLLPSIRIDHFADPLEESPDGRHLYLTTRDHGILIFERIGNAMVDPPDVHEPSHRRLDLIQVEYDQVHFGELTAEDGCLAIENERMDGVEFTLVLSKWQERNVGSEWVDIPNTEQSRLMCSYRTQGNKEFRLIAEIEIDGEVGDYTSNFIGGLEYTRLDSLVVGPGKVTLEDLEITSCQKVTGVILNQKTYTVDHSSWQVRENESFEWEDLPNSEVEGELCPHEPTDDREYRLIGEFVIDNKRALHASNLMKRSVDSS